jgi:hypothetical protein
MKFLTSLLFASLVLPALPARAAESKAVATQMAMRDLWVDHIFWVRSVVAATACKDKKAQAEAEKQVVADAKKIAGAVEPFYGKPASEKLFGLLAGHYGAIKDYMNATLPSPNAAKQKAATDKLTANANEIAEFLSGANPNWPKGTLIGLLAAHGGHHVTQINQFQKKDYAGEAQTWDAMKQHIYILADALTSGIAKQFPDKF